MSIDPHTHAKTDELVVFWVPADTDQSMELKVIRNDFTEVQRLVGGYITVVKGAMLPELHCGCLVTMLVDEDGALKNSPQNMRAQTVFPHDYDVVGDAVFVGYGLIGTFKDCQPGWFSLPPNFVAWEGPGSPFPTQKQPWESD